MGYKKLSVEQEKELVKKYLEGESVKTLMQIYDFASKKSITDKVKKYYPNDYKEIIKQAKNNRKNYNFSLKEIDSPFKAYLIGLLLTDGYVIKDRNSIGLDMTDEDVIKFVAEIVGTNYKAYNSENRKTRYRVLITQENIKEEVSRFGIIENKSLIIPRPQLTKQEEQYLPFIIRGIIDGDGSVSPTSYKGSQFFIVTKSKEFAEWIYEVLVDKFFMEDIHIRHRNSDQMYRIESANQYNILKLIALVYNKPYGMKRKYIELRKTFRDYNKDILLGGDDGIVQTTTEMA